MKTILKNNGRAFNLKAFYDEYLDLIILREEKETIPEEVRISKDNIIKLAKLIKIEEWKNTKAKSRGNTPKFRVGDVVITKEGPYTYDGKIAIVSKCRKFNGVCDYIIFYIDSCGKITSRNAFWINEQCLSKNNEISITLDQFKIMIGEYYLR